MSILQCRNVVVSFGGLQALKGVSVSVPERQISAIIGPNGAGKTTLLNVISGLIKPDSGSVYLKGRDITDLPAHRRGRLGIVRTFQNLEIFTNMTVLENVMTGAHRRLKYNLFDSLFRSPRYFRGERQAKDIAERELEFVGLLEEKDKLASELPFGKQRLLELARAMAAEPEVLLLDEPAAGLNIKETRELGIMINKLKVQRKKTIILVEHDMELVMHISDHITVLNFGEVIAEGTPLEIQKSPVVIAAYLGEEED